MSMWTRGEVRRTWGVSGIGMTVPQVNSWRRGIVIRSGAIPVVLPPPAVALDPSDRRTWTVPVRFT